MTSYRKDEKPSTPAHTPGPIKHLTVGARTARAAFLGARDGWVCHYCHCNLSTVMDKQQTVIAVNLYEHKVITYAEFQSMLATVNPSRCPSPTIDHKLPQADGGTHDIDNLVLCCGDCNSEKSARFTYAQFLLRKRHP